MGSICDMNDLERFMRSEEGNAALEEYAAMLRGKTVIEVEFSSETQNIAMTLNLDDGTSFVVYPPSFDVDSIREEYDDVIQREYYIDYPSRKPAGV